MVFKNWYYSQNRSSIKLKCEKEFGFVYVVKLNFIQGISLLKIGATRDIKTRLSNFPSRTAKIFCVSIPHLNFFENEQILHEHFKLFRVPSRPHQGSQPELFNLSLKDFFNDLPNLNLITDISKTDVINDPVYGKLYETKK